MDKTKKLPAQSISFEFGGNSYEIKFPNNGQFIEIERLKSQLTDGFYSEMKNSSGNGFYATLLVDTVSTFSVLCKELSKDLNKSILEMNVVEAKPLIDIYTNKYLPWFTEWSNLLSSTEQTEDEIEQK